MIQWFRPFPEAHPKKQKAAIILRGLLNQLAFGRDEQVSGHPLVQEI
jgi:hypothetical protein